MRIPKDLWIAERQINAADLSVNANKSKNYYFYKNAGHTIKSLTRRDLYQFLSMFTIFFKVVIMTS